jgi:hypothetical protein
VVVAVNLIHWCWRWYKDTRNVAVITSDLVLPPQMQWSTKFSFFFVPRTSTGEFSNAVYAESSRVYRIFLSGRI